MNEPALKFVLIVVAFAAFFGGWLLCLHALRIGYRMGRHEQIDPPVRPEPAAEFDVLDERERQLDGSVKSDLEIRDQDGLAIY
jgi:hypothetical protein